MRHQNKLGLSLLGHYLLLRLLLLLATSCGDGTAFVDNAEPISQTSAGSDELVAVDATGENQESADGTILPEDVDELLDNLGAAGEGDTFGSEGTGNGHGDGDGDGDGDGVTGDGDSNGDGDGMTGDGDGMPPGDEGTVMPPKNETELKALCQRAELTTTEAKTVTFPNPNKTCEWNKDGNLSRVDSWIRARREQRVDLGLPANALLCDMTFASDEQDMRYDDEIMLLFNDRYILFSSFDYSDRFEAEDNYVVYDWTKIKDTNYVQSRRDDLYCVGKDMDKGDCYMPPTQTRGKMQLEIDSALIRDMSLRTGVTFGDSVDAKPSGKGVSFTFVTTGDNDDSDCQHKDFSFTVTTTHVVLQ